MAVSEIDFLNSLTPGDLLYFKDGRLNSPEPHFFLLAGIKNKSITLFLVGTSKFDNAQKRIEYRKQDSSTLVRIKPDSSINELSTDTYIDCNNCFDRTLSDLTNLVNNNDLRVRGTLKFSDLNQIYNGVNNSNGLTPEEKETILEFLKDYSE